MQNNEYYLKALQDGAYEYRDWVISCFSVCDYDIYDDNTSDTFYDYQLVKRKSESTKLYYYHSNNPDELIELSEYLEGKPLMYYKDRITLKVGDLINVKTDIETNFGNCLFNCIALIYPFKDKIEFITGRVSGRKIENLIASKLLDTPTDDSPRDPDMFYVDELIKHADAVTSLEAFNFTCVPTTSATTMVPNPTVIKRRDELLNKYKDELHKPAIVAKIQEELSALDKSYFKDDKASGFYLSGKAYDVTRMKKFIMLGMIGGLGGEKPELVTTSLAEGWAKESLPSLIDDIRSGSYARGKSTAIAGAGVKLVYNAFQTVNIKTDETENDCGDTEGMLWSITNDNYDMFNGRVMLDGKTLVELTDSLTKEYIGKTIRIRTPLLCKSPPPSYCATCVGKSISMLPNSVHITASAINSIYMNVTMKSMHGKSLKTRKYDIFANIN